MSSAAMEPGGRTSRIVAELELEHPHLVLAPTLDAIDSLTAHPICRDRETLFVRTEVEMGVQIDRAMQNDPTVESITAFGGNRFRVRVSRAAIDPLSVLSSCDGWLETEVGSRGRWVVRSGFAGRSALVRFNRACEDRNISVSVNHLREGTPGDPVVGVTRKQQRLLEIALDRGYFDIPRGASQAELADELDISKSAVSQRLRRAMAALCMATLNGSRR